MKKIVYIFSFTAFTLIIFYNGCKDSLTSSNIDNIVIPDSNVSYSQYIQPVFNAKCISCHGAGSVEGGVDLTSCGTTTADPRIVFPGEPDNSVLVWTVEGNPSEPLMPPPNSSYPPLTQNQINGIKTWIKEGALCN
jgi:Planctomycete cytochrome C